MADPKRILVFRCGQLGDTLVSIPCLRGLRGSYPDAEISWLYDRHVGKSYVVSKEVLSDATLVDHFVSYPVGYTILEKMRAYLGVLSLWVRIRLCPYDLVLHLEPELKIPSRSRRDFWFFRFAGVKQQIQTLPFRSKRSSLLPLESVENEVDFFVRSLRRQGILKGIYSDIEIDLNLGESDTREVQAWRSNHNIPEDCILVALGVGSKMQSKQWPLVRYKTVLQSLISESDIWPIFYGGPEDKSDAEAFIAELGVGSNACGELSLRGAACAMRDCRFYLGNDTGTMHLAVAAGIPCVAVFSARDVPGKWYPYGDGHIVHRVPVACEGCQLYECFEMKRVCLTAITIESVLESCLTVLNRDSDEVPLVEVTDRERRVFVVPKIESCSV